MPFSSGGEAGVFTRLQLKNFKGWEDTGAIRLAPITVFFGSNSSGKTSLLQSILLLKQTAESLDRTRVLHPGDDRTLVDLGTIEDILYGHATDRVLQVLIRWRVPNTIMLANRQPGDELQFRAQLGVADEGQPFVLQMAYSVVGAKVLAAMIAREDATGYDLAALPKLTRRKGRAWPLPPPIRFYGLPDEVTNYFRNADWLADLALELERQLDRVHYVGPLREYPQRSYLWAGERPANVGPRGRLAVPALLAARQDKRQIGRGEGKGRRYEAFEPLIARWLKHMGIIDDFKVHQIAKGRKEYEVRVKRSPGSAEVLITDVGFGVSQVLPVLVQSYYAAEHSTVIFEQPEIHLHPKVQADLADVFTDAARYGKVQFIVESHSEHFLRRLQRRVAEAELVTNKDVALYSCDVEASHSIIQELKVDEYGNIANWPKDFFGDEMGDLAAMTLAGLKRQGGA